MSGQGNPEGRRDGEFNDAEALAAALARDLELLAILHDRELSPEMVEALKRGPAAAEFSIRLRSRRAVAALAALETAIASVPSPVDDAARDELAVHYADVYLRHAYRVQPTESFWLTEDHLERQGPMLEMRAEMRRNGLRLTDWAGRPEDHLVPQLLFVAQLLARAKGEKDLAPVVHLLDAHLLKWHHAFAAGLETVRGPAIYVALAQLTAAWLDEARDLLGQVTGVERRPLEVGQQATCQSHAVTESSREMPYVPGVGPGW